MQLFDGIYRLEERLDQGASAEVWKATDTLTDTTLALKIYSPNGGMGTNGMQMMAHEFRIMVNVSHQNLLKPLHFGLFEGRPYLVLPYCQRGNINKLRGTFDEQRAWTLIRDVAGGLAHLHSMKPPLIHQDIKPANILIADNGDYMLTDFGVSTYAKAYISPKAEENMLLSAGTLAYMAPEKFKSHSTPVMLNDIWALGSTIYEMLSGVTPFGNDGGMLQSESTPIPELPGSFSPQLNSTVASCLSYESWERPSAKDIFETATEALKCLHKGIPLPPLPDQEQNESKLTGNLEEENIERSQGGKEILTLDTYRNDQPQSVATEEQHDEPDTDGTEKNTSERTINPVLLAIVAIAGIILGIFLAFSL